MTTHEKLTRILTEAYHDGLLVERWKVTDPALEARHERLIRLWQTFVTYGRYIPCLTAVCPSCGRLVMGQYPMGNPTEGTVRCCYRKTAAEFHVLRIDKRPALTGYPNRPLVTSRQEWREYLYSPTDRVQRRAQSVPGLEAAAYDTAWAFSQNVYKLTENHLALTMQVDEPKACYWLEWKGREVTLCLKSHRKVVYRIPLPPKGALPLHNVKKYGLSGTRSRAPLYAMPLGDVVVEAPFPVSFHGFKGDLLCYGYAVLHENGYAHEFFATHDRDSALSHCVIGQLGVKS